jgi:hypothetical protein
MKPQYLFICHRSIQQFTEAADKPSLEPTVTSNKFSKKSQLFNLNFRFEHGVDYLSTMVIPKQTKCYLYVSQNLVPYI